MKYLKKYNETVDNTELTKLIELNLEDNGLFEVASIKIVSDGREIVLVIHQDYLSSTDQSLIDLKNQFLIQKDIFDEDYDYMNHEPNEVSDKSYKDYEIALESYEKYMKDSTTKLIERIGKKYDFEVVYDNIDLFELTPHTASISQIYYYQCPIKII